jgi:glutamyl-Q tRNA(Asp) synthetase
VTQAVLRFAPSPNGRLHLGHAYSALLNAQTARRLHGRLLLRIEDIDTTRCRPDFERAIHEDLAWLGLSFEEPIRRQSDHFADYRCAAEALRQRRLLYPCFCTRGALGEAARHREATTGLPALRDPDGAPLYPGTCRDLGSAKAAELIAKGVPHAWRLRMDEAAAGAGPLVFTAFDLDGTERIAEARPERWGDAVLVRKETPTSYHLSVVVDDALQGVTHVVRGQDLEAATDLHRLLQALLGLPVPAYHHHGLIRAPEGDKLSKSLRSESLADLRARGVTAEDIIRRLGFDPWGLSPSPKPAAEYGG